MRIENSGRMVVLSRRNLEALLAKLDGIPANSGCTIFAPAAYGHFAVRAEENEAHYQHPERLATVGDSRAGRMHPETESKLSEGVETV